MKSLLFQWKEMRIFLSLLSRLSPSYSAKIVFELPQKIVLLIESAQIEGEDLGQNVPKKIEEIIFRTV